MPELPEVETIRRGLVKELAGLTLFGLAADESRVFRTSAAVLRTALSRAELLAVERHGKYLFLRFRNGILLLHLGMTGRLLVRNQETSHEPKKEDDSLPRHLHLRLFFEDDVVLEFWDTRLFGRVEWFPQATGPVRDLFPHLGPDPLSGEYREADFYERLKRHGGTRIKSLLIDQSFLAGLGNIYADEVLFRTRIHPARRVGGLRRFERAGLFTTIPNLLQEAIRKGGTTWRDYVNSTGGRGNFADELQVYARTGMPCRICGEPVRRLVLGGRSSHFCPRCQPRQGTFTS
ncbi:MAG TPA: bifunctional DNA-formamidopyrimidine glycosylase/DNA-(apurinic or apyrimidinic site) lyase [Acidobacteriota bacterium]|nr:bifunctional DNA-formamidopyrimidine glycosylase/DNA-(apurinic or apyrimidinic site) lyase [Acidobacteriota bacterium]HRR25596.1 bifunctional DNA-formamidopyrimidine glycosylase/DNA-(apurinic or apyrimidinic site) lyase [Acidobacteriota bacterium]HRV08748.1 bifunctional DNA-formamidopyrimidine glycosylase/DNA-(apurinic or apyrimidinic site) lyase [Acidobacteriota bacterium]